jgi:PTH2 family peptidyl-tRNA hydrolase
MAAQMVLDHLDEVQLLGGQLTPGEKMTKQVIVIRKDLKMRRGKEIAQGSHASIAFLTRRLQRKGKLSFKDFSKAEQDWLKGSFAKVVCRVESEEELRELAEKAKEAGLECHLITDSGRTEFDGVPTLTALAIGPDKIDKIDKITGELKLY